MKKLLNRYKNWSLPSKMTFWGFVFGIISTPSAIIGYFQFFGNEDISNRLYKLLQVNSRAYIRVKSVNTPIYKDEGKVLVLTIENLSNFQVRNIKTKILISKDTVLTGKFHSIVLSNENLGIPPKTTSKIAVIPLSQLSDYIHKKYPKYKIMDIVLLNQSSTKSGIGYPFYITISYKTDGNEDMNKFIALNAILRLKS